MSKTVNWCFTHYGIDDELEHPEYLMDILKKFCKFAVFQQEECPTTFKMHYQGFVVTRSQKSVACMYNHYPFHWSMKVPKSSPYQAADYCRKEETRIDGPWEFGEWPLPRQQGARSDLTAVADLIKTGATVYQVANVYSTEFIRYHGGITRLVRLQPVVKPKPYVCWCYGPSGTGKTHHARHAPARLGVEDIKRPVVEGDIGLLDVGVPTSTCSSPERIFEFYDPAKPRFIFDEYAPSQIPQQLLKRYLSDLDVNVKVLFDAIPFVPREIYITCPFAPWNYWSGNELAEIMRRCNDVIAFQTVYEEVDEVL